MLLQRFAQQQAGKAVLGGLLASVGLGQQGDGVQIVAEAAGCAGGGQTLQGLGIGIIEPLGLDPVSHQLHGGLSLHHHVGGLIPADALRMGRQEAAQGVETAQYGFHLRTVQHLGIQIDKGAAEKVAAAIT